MSSGPAWAIQWQSQTKQKCPDQKHIYSTYKHQQQLGMNMRVKISPHY